MPRSTAQNIIKHTRQNIVCVAAGVHALITAGKIRVIGTNADKPLAFRWTAAATPREREGITLRDERMK